MGAENLFQSQSKKIERGDQACPDSDGVIESRKDVQRNQLREFIEEYPQLGNKEVVSNKNKLQ